MEGGEKKKCGKGKVGEGRGAREDSWLEIEERPRHLKISRNGK